MNHKNYVISKIQNIDKENIRFTNHANIRITQRQLNKDEIIENIINPFRLKYAILEEQGKFDCYFEYSKTQCHKYVIKIENNIIVITVIKINRRWQIIAEKKILKGYKNV